MMNLRRPVSPPSLQTCEYYVRCETVSGHHRQPVVDRTEYTLNKGQSPSVASGTSEDEFLIFSFFRPHSIRDARGSEGESGS